MIASGLKKLAKEHGMTVAAGVAYGSMGGFAATLSEGSNYKRIVFATHFRDAAHKEGLMAEVERKNVQKEFRVTRMGVNTNCITVEFHDTIGTMKKLRSFLTWFLPQLQRWDASPWNSCPECGMPVESGHWALVDGTAYYLHEACGRKLEGEIAESNTRRREEAAGSYLSGAIGALLGALPGAVVWAVVLMLGYVASIVGFLIGWLAEKGYRLLKGKEGKGKIAILIVVIILGVVLGTLFAEGVTVAQMISSGELYGFQFTDIPLIILVTLSENPDYLMSLGSNVLMGLLFAALGVWTILRQTGSEVADVKYRKL